MRRGGAADRALRRRDGPQGPPRMAPATSHLSARRCRADPRRGQQATRPDARSVRACSGPRPEEVVPGSRGTTSANGRFAPATRSAIAYGSRRCLCLLPGIFASGSSPLGARAGRLPCSHPMTTTPFGTRDDWRNWRNRMWKGQHLRPANDRRRNPRPHGAAPPGTRSRHVRSSCIRLRGYRGSPPLRRPRPPSSFGVGGYQGGRVVLSRFLSVPGVMVAGFSGLHGSRVWAASAFQPHMRGLVAC